MHMVDGSAWGVEGSMAEEYTIRTGSTHEDWAG